MGYMEDITTKFYIDASGITENNMLSVVKDMCLEEALKRMLQDEQNLVNGRIATAKEVYLKPFDEKVKIAKVMYEETLAKNDAYSIEVLTTKSAYDKAVADANPMMVTIEHLEPIDAGIKEAARQAMSYEQNTLSGNVRDACDKIRNNRQGIVKVTVKSEK